MPSNPRLPRIAQEHAAVKRAAEEAASQPPNKRRRLPRGVQGIHASDMSLVTPENAPTRGGWRVTATGRIVRPVRMRPEHPLPEPVDSTKPVDKAKGKARKRMRDPPTRARRRTIDPTKYGSTHLKGIFLENAAAFVNTQAQPAARAAESSESESTDEEDEDEDGSESVAEEEETDQNVDDVSASEEPEAPSTAARIPTTPKSPSVNIAKPHAKTTAPAVLSELAEETSKALNLLQSLFGDKEEWGDAESIGSDVDEADIRAASGTQDVALKASKSSSSTSEDEGAAMQVDGPVAEEEPLTQQAAAEQQGAQKTKLKDLFAPREEEGALCARFTLA